MLSAGGGLSGGDSDLLQRLATTGSESDHGDVAKASSVNPRRLACILERVGASRSTGCWQQECEPDIATVSHICPILSQHFRSSDVICQSGDTQARDGREENVSAIRMAANCETLVKICERSCRLRVYPSGLLGGFTCPLTPSREACETWRIRQLLWPKLRRLCRTSRSVAACFCRRDFRPLWGS